MKKYIEEQEESNKWIQAKKIKKTIKSKKVARKCSVCTYYHRLKQGKPISPECQHRLFTNTEVFCTQYMPDEDRE